MQSRHQEVSESGAIYGSRRLRDWSSPSANSSFSRRNDRLAYLNMHAPAPRPVAHGALCETAARLRLQSPALCLVRERNEGETSGLRVRDQCLTAGSAPDSATFPPSPSVTGLVLTPASSWRCRCSVDRLRRVVGGWPPWDTCAVPFTLSSSYEKATKLQPLVFANLGGMPNTWLDNTGTLGPLSPNSESLLSLYDQPFGGHGVWNNPFPSSGLSAPEPSCSGGAGRGHHRVRHPARTQEEVTKSKGS